MKSTSALILTISSFFLHMASGYLTVESNAPMNVFIDNIFWYELYARDELWEANLEALAVMGNSTMSSLAESYSGYIMKIRCNQDHANADTPVGSACCLESGNGHGGFCVSDGKTFQMTAGDFQTFYHSNAATAILDPDWLGVDYDSFGCDSNGNDYTCHRFQPSADAETDGLPRFDGDSTDVKAYYFEKYHEGDPSKAFDYYANLSTLTGATTFAASVTAIVALFMSTF